MSEAIPTMDPTTSVPERVAVETDATQYQAPPQTPATAPPPKVAMPEWDDMRQNLPIELRDSAALKGVKSFEDLAKNHVEVQHLIGGEKVVRPTDKSSKEDWDRFYKQTGRPDEVSGYNLGDFKPPPGAWDPKFAEGMLEDFHAAGLSNKQANEVMRSYGDRQGNLYSTMQGAIQSAKNETDKQLRTQWGDGYDANIEMAHRAFKHAFGDNAEQVAQIVLPDGRAMGDHPYFVEAFHRLSQTMGEHGLLGDKTSQGPVLTPEMAQQKIAELEANSEFQAVFGDRDKQNHPLRTQWRQLYSIAYGE